MKNLTLSQKIVFAFLISFGLFFFALYTKPQWQSLINGRTEFVPLTIEEILGVFDKKDKAKISFLETKGLTESKSGMNFIDFNDMNTILSAMVNQIVCINSDSTYSISVGVFPNRKVEVKTLTIAYTDEDLHKKYLTDFKESGFLFSPTKNNNIFKITSAEKKTTTGSSFLITMKLGRYYTLTIFNANANSNIKFSNNNTEKIITSKLSNDKIAPNGDDWEEEEEEEYSEVEYEEPEENSNDSKVKNPFGQENTSDENNPFNNSGSSKGTGTEMGQDESSIITNVDEEAEFIGGHVGRNKFIAQNLQYPPNAIEENLEGKCFVSCIVDRDGYISNVKVEKGLSGCPLCDKEALRIVKRMPKWNPAKVNGKNVKSRIMIPILFQID